MSLRCDICAKETVEEGHDESQRHLKNVLLAEFEMNKKQFGENKNGIVVLTSVWPTAYNDKPVHVDSELSVLKASVKPREGVNFKFTIRNDNATDDIVFHGISSLADNKLNYKLTNQNLSFGDTSYRIMPQTCLGEEILVNFEHSSVGVYKQPIYFFFTVASGQPTVILREMMVFVDKVSRKHFKVKSPYAKLPVFAKIVEPTIMGKKNDNDLFGIPNKDLKKVFARDLKTEGDDITEEQEALAEKIKAILDKGPVEDNYIDFFHNLLWYEEVVIGSNLKNYNMSGVSLDRTHSKKSYMLLVPGLAEKRPSLLLGDLAYVRPHNQTMVMFEAIITDIHDNFVQFGGLLMTFHKYYNAEAKFDIRFVMSRLPLERMHVAVESMREHTDKVFPKENELVPPTAPVTQFYNPLVKNNPEQRSVVEHIVAKSSGSAPYLLHGPPGTGKTVTIVEAILQLVTKDPNNRIIICTDSNMAADHVATLIIQYWKLFPPQEFLLRANSQYRVWDSMPEALEPYSNGTCREDYYRVSIDEFADYSIVVTTLVHAAKFAYELQRSGYDRVTTHVFIDEAAQASEPASLIPVCGLLIPGGSLVLAGDPQQLGPVVFSREVGKHGLGVSLMERLKNHCALYSDKRNDPNYMVMLKKNFRSHQDIISIPDELFYKGQLEAMAPVDKINNVDILGEEKTSRAIGFYGVQSMEQRIGKSPSFYNSAELEIVQEHIMALLDVHGVAESDIGVITPYIRQVYKMKKWLREQELYNVEVGTVESFQGKEKRVIIMSTVRANCDLFAHDAKFRLGFLVDPKRFNVALTRARAKLIVIGNPTCLQKDTKWQRYMVKCRELGSYRGFDMGPDMEAQQCEAVEQISQIIQTLKNMNV